MRHFSNWATVAAVVCLIGCVVIPSELDLNIDVTIRHIEEQADQFLDYVEGKSDVLPGLDVPEPESTSLLRRTVDFLSPVQVVYAAELNQTSPRVSQIAQKMKARYPDVQAVKATGAVGESNRGLLEMVKPERIASPEERNKAQRIVAAENEDRKALYKEIARINKDQNLNVGTVERVYAQERLERAKVGEVFQLPPSGADFNAFKASAAGKRLQDRCVAGAWVTIQ